MIAPLQKEPPASKRQALSLCLLIVSLGLFSAPWSQAGIAQTKHNLTGTDGGPVMNVCIFCHTPAGDPNAAAEPSWNANSGDDHTTFTTFDDLGRLDPDRDGATGTVSVACLSCHDDAQALGVTALSFDHPFGVAYRGVILEGIDLDQLPGQSADASSDVTLVQGSFKAPPKFSTRTVAANGFRVPTYGIIDDSPTWWVDTGLEGRQRTDLKLYSRHFGDDITVPFIECASCHDPHTETETFLRIENQGSALCLSCHDI